LAAVHWLSIFAAASAGKGQICPLPLSSDVPHYG
jgi:hypothetical protein